MTRDGWQIVPRLSENGHRQWWLQQRQPNGSWTDYSGPYRQRGSATARYQRMEFSWLMAVRHDPKHIHTWSDDAPGFRRCTVCRIHEHQNRRE